MELGINFTDHSQSLSDNFQKFRSFPGQGSRVLGGDYRFKALKHDIILPLDLRVIKLAPSSIGAVTLFPVSVTLDFPEVFFPSGFYKLLGPVRELTFQSIVAIAGKRVRFTELRLNLRVEFISRRHRVLLISLVVIAGASNGGSRRPSLFEHYLKRLGNRLI